MFAYAMYRTFRRRERRNFERLLEFVRRDRWELHSLARRDKYTEDRYLSEIPDDIWNFEQLLEFVRRDRQHLFSSVGRGNYTEDRYLPEIFEKQLIEIQRSIRSSVRVELTKQMKEAITEAIFEALSTNPQAARIKHFDSSEPLIHELSHALFTPLSQMEASLLSLPILATDKANVHHTIESLRTSLDMCKVILGAFQEQSTISSTSRTWSPSSLRTMLIAAASVYNNSRNRNIKVDINMPEQIEGYSNNYITGFLLPLLENAIEASVTDGNITIIGRQADDIYLIEMTNEVEEPSVPDRIYEDGYTTKQNHEGAGLTIVQHLLAAYVGSSLSHHLTDHHVTFSVKLPMRSSDAN